MAIKQLNDEQIRTWTLAQKDQWWLDNVWRGDMPQLTWRAALTGMLLGGTLSLTNLYVGAKTGWTLGVGITSVILAFAMFKVLSRAGLAHEFTVLENNCMQSIATAAGYMTGPLISSLAAYMVVTEQVIPMLTTVLWITSLSVLGVLFAFPLKRRFINDEQQPFPEGRAAGIVMDALHTGDSAEGLLKAKILAVSGGLSALVKLLTSHAILERVRLSFLAVPEYLDGWLYRFWTPQHFDPRQLTIRLDTDIVMFGAGGLMGIRIGTSLMIGAVVNYCLLVPWMIERGDIQGALVDGVLQYGFRRITVWALWGGVAMMTTASLYAFFARPQILVNALRGMLRRKTAADRSDVLKDIELPGTVFVLGIPLVGGVVVLLAQPVLRRRSVARHRGHSAHLRLHADRREFHGTDVHHPDQCARQADAIDVRRAGSGQYSHESGDRGDHGRSGQQRLQPADGHQAGVHAGGQATPTGDRPRAGHFRRRDRGRPDFLSGVSRERTEPTDQRPVPDALGDRLEGRRRTADRGSVQSAGLGPLGGARRCPARHRVRGTPIGHQGSFLGFRRGRRTGRGDPLQHVPGHVPRLAVLLAQRAEVARSAVGRPPHRGAEPGTDLRRTHRRRCTHGHHRDAAGDVCAVNGGDPEYRKQGAPHAERNCTRCATVWNGEGATRTAGFSPFQAVPSCDETLI